MRTRSTRICTVDECDGTVEARDLCAMHYQRQKRTGDLGGPGRKDRSGPGNSNWRGGRVRGGHQNRYWKVWQPEHSAADPNGYVLEHRLVMEAHLGRRLTTDEVVHHLNEDPSDNRVENLAVMSQTEHARLHTRGAA